MPSAGLASSAAAASASAARRLAAGARLAWLHLRSRRVPSALLALALYAVNPLAVRVGDAMRPYGRGYALALLALVLTWKFVEKPSWPSWLLAAFFSLLSVLCLYLNAFLLAAFGLAGRPFTSTCWQGFDRL